MATLLKCILGPSLISIHRGVAETERYLYQPNIAERYSNTIIRSLKLAGYLSIFTLPVTVPIFYRKDFFERSRVVNILKFMFAFGFIYIGSLFVRGIGRYANSDYTTFIVALEAACANFTKDTKKTLQKYDFSFWAWPIEFRYSQIAGEFAKSQIFIPRSTRSNSYFGNIVALPCQIVSYCLAHTIGRWLLYPGSLGIFQSLMENVLAQGKGNLLDKYDGQRFKLEARDRNHIDVMFIDRRKKEDNGSTLVICCEGNAGFYEVGIMETPLKANYSVVGWNHPGFGGSTGLPFPNQEINAIDVVMQFAINELGFRVDDIVIYAWSIGGFTGTWVAMNYPEIKGLILDATFDDLVPMAVERMPRSWKSLVVRTVKDYLNLDIAEQLCKYKGKTIMVRRTRDEVITTDEASGISGNRINILLKRFLQVRYPNLLTSDTQLVLKEYLSQNDPGQQLLIWNKYGVDDEFCEETVVSSYSRDDGAFPSSLGEKLSDEERSQLTLYLATKYLLDFDATHCIPLPVALFQLPWYLSGAQIHSPPLLTPKL